MQKVIVRTISIVLLICLGMAGSSYQVAARPLGAVSPSLGAATTFAVLAAQAMSSATTTTISGDLGLSPGIASSKTGNWTMGGSEYFGPGTLAAQAQTDALAAFNNLAGQTSNGTWDLNINPPPGVWTSASSSVFAGTLTLTGNAADVWVFQIADDLTFTGSVVMAGSAQPCNVFWQISRDATIASGSSFIGTLIASRDITLVSGATVNGRILSLNGDLTTDNNTITIPVCAVAATSTPAATGTSTSVAETPVPEATLLPIITALPGTGAAPIRSEGLPAGFVAIAGLGAIAFVLASRAMRSTSRRKQ